jgi:glycerol-3-phosphate dehydrogenase
LIAEYPNLPAALLQRYARLYGTRARDMLAGTTSIAGLGRCFGADLHEREIEFLTRTEWARTAADIVWRRTKLGLRLTPAEVAAVSDYVERVGIGRPA